MFDAEDHAANLIMHAARVRGSSSYTQIWTDARKFHPQASTAFARTS